MARLGSTMTRLVKKQFRPCNEPMILVILQHVLVGFQNVIHYKVLKIEPVTVHTTQTLDQSDSATCATSMLSLPHFVHCHHRFSFEPPSFCVSLTFGKGLYFGKVMKLYYLKLKHFFNGSCIIIYLSICF